MGFQWLRSAATYLGTTIDGLAKPNVFLVLGALVPILAWDALWVGVDAGVASGEVAIGLDGIHGAALVGVDPVEAYPSEKVRLWEGCGKTALRASKTVAMVTYRCSILGG